MKINLAKSAGFCFGVKRALEIAIKTTQSNKRVFMLGDIVHNEDVVREIKKSGIKKIRRLTRGKNKTLLIRAHGMSMNLLDAAHRFGYKIIDATCPMVKEIHKIVGEREKQGDTIIIIGDREHEEVRGIVGQLKNKTIIVNDIQGLPQRMIKKIKKASVVVQSTQNLDRVTETVKILKSYITDLKFFNTVCKPTRTKQAEIKIMPLKNDVMIIIGSKNSANTKRLYEISRSLNQNTYWVQSAKQIKSDWFKGARDAGITAGASTPDQITQDVIKRISNIKPER